VQLHPVPEIAVAVKPLGSESVAATVPLVGPGPALATVSVYVSPVSPWVKFPTWLFAIVRSATCVIVVGSVVESFAVLSSPPPETAAEFVTELDAPLATLTVTVIDGYEDPDASASERVQVSVPSVKLHPVPEIAVAVKPLGSVSVAVTVPLVGPGPAFETASVYASPVSPCVKFPE
jgi:hypothetical protein